MEERNYKVYIHRNKINGKAYVGITCRSVKSRWHNGNGYKQNQHFYSAIKKYGWNAFDHLIVYQNMTKEEACKAEIALIKFFGTTDARFGYNNSYGGEHGIHSEHTKQAISAAGKTKTGEMNSFFGRKHREDSKEKMRQAKLNDPKHQERAKLAGDVLGRMKAKRVVQYDLDGNKIAEYPSTVEASLAITGSKFSHIPSVCRNHRKTAYGYRWSYAEEVV